MSVSNNNTRQAEVSGSKKSIKRDQELHNPCWKEHTLVAQCLERNHCDYKECQLYVQNYTTCKSFWGDVMSKRKKANIKPYLPLPEEREKIKAEYLNSRKR